VSGQVGDQQVSFDRVTDDLGRDFAGLVDFIGPSSLVAERVHGFARLLEVFRDRLR
jgi:hypothetical protein